MSVFHLESLFAPVSLAMIGRFASPSHKDRILLRNLCNSRCEDVSIVDLDGAPRPEGLPGCGRWYAGLGALDREVDVLVAALPVREVPEVLDACGALRAKNIILTHRRMTWEDERCEEQIARRARSTSTRLLGLNSFGVIVPGVGLNTSFFETEPADGRIALISQSGSLLSSILDMAQQRKIGLSHVVSVGSLIDIDFGDVIDYLVWEKSVRCVLLYIENLASVKKFLSACRAAARTKPIVAIKGGRSPLGREIIAKHTGRLAGEDTVYDTGLRRAGIIRVETIEELLSAGESLSEKAIPRGERLGIVTNSGGMGVLVADSLSAEGATITQLSPALRSHLEQYVAPYSGSLNPICIAGDADSDRYSEVIRSYVDSGEFDTVMVIMVLSGVFSPEEVAERMRQVATQKKVDLVYIWLGDRARHVRGARRLAARGDTIYRRLEDATRAYSFSMKYFDKLSKVVVVPPRFDRSLAFRREEAKALIDGFLAEGAGERGDVDTSRLLALYGIPVDDGCAGEVLYELKAGARYDVEFGPYLFFGVGGLMSRVIGNEAVILPPLNRSLARRLVEKSGLAGPMALPAAGVEQLEEILVRLSQLIVDFPEIRDLEINPLAWCGDGFVARDARSVLQEAGIASPYHLATAPYPNQYEFSERLRDGTEVLVRPIRPEDAASHFEFIKSLSSQTIYNRFFGFMKIITDEQMVRFTQIDYDREIAIVARVTVEGHEITIGVNRLAYDPHGGTYEFAVVVADPWQGTGVASLLMEKLLLIARDRQIKTIFGLVLPGNRRMLALARKFGFVVSDRDEDGVTIRLDLV